MTFPQGAALPQGSLILVTGATGYVASLVVDQLLFHGYRVRGTVRDPKSDKASWMPEHFDKTYGPGKFEMVQVADMQKKGCLDDAVEGCDGVIHVASVVKFEADPNDIIPPSLALLDNALEAAAKEPAIKRFVFTSSSAAANQNRFNEVYDLTEQSWGEWAVEAAWQPPPYRPERALANYCASKVLAEQRVWRFVEERKPHFVVNTVLPDFVIGLGVKLEKEGRAEYASSVLVLKGLFDGSGEEWKAFYPQYMVDGVDTALLHVAALTNGETKGQRIFGYAHPKTWTDFISRLKGMYPNRTFPDPDPNEGNDLSNVVGRKKAEDLLKWMGRPGWRPLEESLKEVCDSMQ